MVLQILQLVEKNILNVYENIYNHTYFHIFFNSYDLKEKSFIKIIAYSLLDSGNL